MRRVAWTMRPLLWKDAGTGLDDLRIDHPEMAETRMRLFLAAYDPDPTDPLLTMWDLDYAYLRAQLFSVPVTDWVTPGRLWPFTLQRAVDMIASAKYRATGAGVGGHPVFLTDAQLSAAQCVGAWMGDASATEL